jgi:hypothetical protein
MMSLHGKPGQGGDLHFARCGRSQVASVSNDSGGWNLRSPYHEGAGTWALGKVFILHSESGGTALSFDPAEMKFYFSES